MHFQPTCAAHDSFDDLLKKSRLKERLPDYDQANRRRYSDEEIAQARKNAERMNENTKRGAARVIPIAPPPSRWRTAPERSRAARRLPATAPPAFSTRWSRACGSHSVGNLWVALGGLAEGVKEGAGGADVGAPGAVDAE